MAIHAFITDKDLDVGMKQYFRDQIIETNTHILTTSEGAAFSLIKSKLTGRYDLLKLFPSTKLWSGSIDYLKDQYIFKNDKFYKALQDGTNQDPETQTAYWVEEDPRDKLLVIFCVRITIYFIVEALPTRKVSQDIINDFDSAIEWLDNCKSGIENPDWPLLINGSSIINWGSNEKLDHYY
jgi:phage gp36-like protein